MNKYSYYSTLLLLVLATGVFVVAPMVGVPSLFGLIISYTLAIACGLAIAEYTRRFTPE